VVTGFDLKKWSSDRSDTQASPLAAMHQEGQQAKAATLATYGALNYDGLPGINLGGSVYNGGVGQKQPDVASPSASVTLTEVHARWQAGKWDLSTLAASGRFHDVDAFNATAVGISNPCPVYFGAGMDKLPIDSGSRATTAWCPLCAMKNSTLRLVSLAFRLV
jgi:hypothetical protein